MCRRCVAGIGAAVLLADLVYDVPANVILDSARRALSGYDVITSCIKAWVFGLIISTVSADTGGGTGAVPPPLSRK
jgi:ABC-type transporter Mla maintaining outer membrane lipid asymmetry permease subunit MlaE